MVKPAASGSVNPGHTENDLVKLRAVTAEIQRIRLSARHELEMAKRMRADAQRYQQEIETKARSQAQQLLLHTRISTQKEIDGMIQKASTEIQKLLTDIRMIRITAQEELAAQQKFTDAARINALSLELKDEVTKPAKI